MKKQYMALLAAGALVCLQSLPASAGVIDRACRQSDRPASSSLCSCIQQVAEVSLSKSEQKRVAKWFSDPHQAQEVRMSDKRSDERLWERYKIFGQRAQKVCS